MKTNLLRVLFLSAFLMPGLAIVSYAKESFSSVLQQANVWHESPYQRLGGYDINGTITSYKPLPPGGSDIGSASGVSEGDFSGFDHVMNRVNKGLVNFSKPYSSGSEKREAATLNDGGQNELNGAFSVATNIIKHATAAPGGEAFESMGDL